MPIEWDELEHIEPADFGMDNTRVRLHEAGDKWRDILKMKHKAALT